MERFIEKNVARSNRRFFYKLYSGSGKSVLFRAIKQKLGGEAIDVADIHPLYVQTGDVSRTSPFLLFLAFLTCFPREVETDKDVKVIIIGSRAKRQMDRRSCSTSYTPPIVLLQYSVRLS